MKEIEFYCGQTIEDVYEELQKMGEPCFGMFNEVKITSKDSLEELRAKITGFLKTEKETNPTEEILVWIINNFGCYHEGVKTFGVNLAMAIIPNSKKQIKFIHLEDGGELTCSIYPINIKNPDCEKMPFGDLPVYLQSKIKNYSIIITEKYNNDKNQYIENRRNKFLKVVGGTDFLDDLDETKVKNMDLNMAFLMRLYKRSQLNISLGKELATSIFQNIYEICPDNIFFTLLYLGSNEVLICKKKEFSLKKKYSTIENILSNHLVNYDFDVNADFLVDVNKPFTTIVERQEVDNYSYAEDERVGCYPERINQCVMNDSLYCVVQTTNSGLISDIKKKEVGMVLSNRFNVPTNQRGSLNLIESLRDKGTSIREKEFIYEDITGWEYTENKQDIVYKDIIDGTIKTISADDFQGEDSIYFLKLKNYVYSESFDFKTNGNRYNNEYEKSKIKFNKEIVIKINEFW